MIYIISSYLVGILISNETASINLLIILLLIFSLSINILKRMEWRVLICILFFIAGFIYPQVKLNSVRDIEYNDYGRVNTEFIVRENRSERLLVSSKGRNYFIYENKGYLPGDVIKIEGTFRKFANDMNPYTFKLKSYYEKKGISGFIFIDDCRQTGISRNLFIKIKRMSCGIRNGIIKRFDKRLSDNVSGLLQGIFIGQKEALDDEIREDFGRIGISHIIAVSGAHVAFVLLPFRFMIFRLVKRKKIRILLMCPVAIIYLFVAGAGTSVTRAVIMLLMLFFLDFTGRRGKSFDVLILTGFLMLLYNPFYIYDAAFLLSFCSTGGIMMMSGKIKKSSVISKLPGPLKAGIAVSLSAQIAILPVLLYFFNSISLVFLFSNVLFLPVTQILTILTMLWFIPFLSPVISPLLEFIASRFIYFASLISSFPFAVIILPATGVLSIFIYYLFVSQLFFVSASKRISSNILLTLLCVSLVFKPVAYDMEINFFCAGNGDSALITTKDGMNILIDGGDNKVSFGKYALVPYLTKRGILYIDMIFLTHSHSDHMDGIIDVIGNIRTGAVFIPDTNNTQAYNEFKDLAEDKDIPVFHVKRGDTFTAGKKIGIEILNPIKGNIYDNANDESIVMDIRYNGYSFLFTGDIEKQAEQDVHDILEGTDLLKVSHHGSNTSSSEDFLEKTAPRISVVSAGKNPYGHPSKKVIERLERYGTAFITKYDGYLKFSLKNDILYINKYTN